MQCYKWKKEWISPTIFIRDEWSFILKMLQFKVTSINRHLYMITIIISHNCQWQFCNNTSQNHNSPVTMLMLVFLLALVQIFAEAENIFFQSDQGRQSSLIKISLPRQHNYLDYIGLLSSGKNAWPHKIMVVSTW